VPQVNLQGRSQHNNGFLFPQSINVDSFPAVTSIGASAANLQSSIDTPSNVLGVQNNLQPSLPDTLFGPSFPQFDFSNSFPTSFVSSSQLTQQVPVSSPTSNHLPTDTEQLLISSYSSLDANPTQSGDFGGELLDVVRPIARGKSILSSRQPQFPSNGNAIDPVQIKPLPIDISTLPLESNERAEGLRKLWSSITSRKEFTQLFETLTNNNSQTNINETSKPKLSSGSVLNRFRGSTPSTQKPSLVNSDTTVNPDDIRLIQQHHDRIQEQVQRQRNQQLLLQKQQQERLRQKLEETSLLSTLSTTVQSTSQFQTPLEEAFRNRNGQQQAAPQAIRFFNLNRQFEADIDSTQVKKKSHKISMT